MITVNEILISRAQLRAIDEIAPSGQDPNRNIHLEQTHTESGGTHLYVRAGLRFVHISAAGKVQELDA